MGDKTRIIELQRRYLEATRSRDEALAALKMAEEALEPFARQADTHNEQFPNSMFIDDYEHPKGEPWKSMAQITLGDLRRARAALENSKSRLADCGANLEVER